MVVVVKHLGFSILIGIICLLILTGCGQQNATPDTVDQAKNLFYLVHTVEQAEDDKVRLQAVERLIDQLSIPRRAQEGIDNTIAQIDNQALLEKIIAESKHFCVRESTLAHLTNQTVLASFFFNPEATLLYPPREVFKIIINQEILAQITANAGDEEIRMAATAQLASQELLKKIAIDSLESSSVRKVAIKKINNQAFLADITMSVDNHSIGEMAAKKLTDPAILGKVGVWIDSKKTAQVRDRELLEEIVSKTWNSRVKDAAVLNLKLLDGFFSWAGCEASNIGQLTEQQFLAVCVATSSYDSNQGYKTTTEASRAAFKKLTDPVLLEKARVWLSPRETKKVEDQSLLAQIAVSSSNWNVREVAVKKLTDDATVLSNQQCLVKVALDYQGMGNYNVVAARKLTDQKLLERVAMAATDPRVRDAAVEKITNPSVLKRIGIWVDPKQTRQLNDQKLLTEIAVNATTYDVRNAALNEVNDQALLLQVIWDQSKPIYYKDAVARVVKQSALFEIALKHRNQDARDVATKKLNNQAFLARIAASSWGGYPCSSVGRSSSADEIALHKLTDQDMLTQIALRDEVYDIRYAAAKKLNNHGAALLVATRTSDPLIRSLVVSHMTEKEALEEVCKTHSWQMSYMGDEDRGNGSELAEIRLLAMNPQIVEHLGHIKVTINVSSMEKNYDRAFVRGERITVQLWSEKHPLTLSFVWETDFPDSFWMKQGDNSRQVRPAPIKVSDVKEKLLEKIPEPYRQEIELSLSEQQQSIAGPF